MTTARIRVICPTSVDVRTDTGRLPLSSNSILLAISAFPARRASPVYDHRKCVGPVRRCTLGRPIIPEVRLTLRVPAWLDPRSLPTGAYLAAGFAAFNLLLFVPIYLLLSQENNFWPFFPLGHPRGDYDWGWPGIGRSTYEYVMQLFVRRHNKDIFRVSADWVFIVSSLVLVSRFASNWRRAVVPLAGIAYAGLLAFMAYSGFVHYLFDRPGTLLDDVLMLESAWIVVRDAWGLTDFLYAAVLLAAATGLGLLVARYLQAAWHWGATLPPRHVAAGWVLVNAYCLLSLTWFGVERDDPLVQLQAKHAVFNLQRSQAVLETVDALSGSVVPDAARLDDTAPVRQPDVYLFSIESYGAALWADDDYRSARQGLMRRVQDGLDELELPTFTRFVTSPVYGGGSWMSTASALSGIRIENHSTYWAWKRIAHRYPHLIAYLERHGYYTLSVQPGATWNEDLYGYDDVIIREDFSYDAFDYGFGHVPDQWALDYAFNNYWSRHPRPRLFHFVATATHYAWEAPPRITEDVADLAKPQPAFLETRPDYVELALTVPQGQKRDFFVTVAYEWELLLDTFRNRIEPGFIALILGDHQPPFIAGGRGDNDVALHVVTDVAALPEPLAWAGFTPGADAPWDAAATTEFRMEAIYPFLVSVLASESGEPLEFSPTGIAAPELPAW
ncbi:MAG: hypothetical protein F4Y45_17895 [Acidobacteria bacterium]|nr:hypothetical protein [Acidobacteriota bacterium]MXZ73370.1 hypothetical protein [Acidobacteriota bacterium]MYJ05224.1 hypothetical protein [Acidobacteriota bacterium]